MNCWEILGIEPTRDRDRIEAAYERQSKFASGEEADRLQQAYREALGGEPTPGSSDRPELQVPPANAPSPGMPPAQATQDRDTLSASDQQIVREVIIQINALLNDSQRIHDAQIWKAILGEPPADQAPLRREIGAQLEQRIRPMAENGSFAATVARFLGDWFDWYSLRDVPEEYAPGESGEQGESAGDEPEEQLKPQMVNFWPAVIGWIIGLAILASLFSGLGGGG